MAGAQWVFLEVSWVWDQGGGAGRRKLDPGGQVTPGLGQEAENGGKEGMRARTCSSVLGQLQGSSCPSHG